MPSENIQWFPGHMAKTRRMISENLKNVDIVIEILDARIPLSSRNPEIVKLTEGKPSLIILNKASLADPAQNKLWVEHYSSESSACILVDCLTGEGPICMAAVTISAFVSIARPDSTCASGILGVTRAAMGSSSSMRV